VHVLDTKASEAFAAAISVALEVNKVNEEAIQRELDGHLKEGILALSKAMEYADLPTVVRKRVIEDLGVVRIHSRIFRVYNITTNKLDARGEDELALVEALENLKAQSVVINVEHIELHLFAHSNRLLRRELMLLKLRDKFAERLAICY